MGKSGLLTPAISLLTGDPSEEARVELSHNKDMVTLDTLRAEQRDEILRLAEWRGARSLRVFGSVARGEAKEGSDLDLLLEWEPGRSLLDHAGLVQDLQELLGMKVHVGLKNPCTGMCATGSFARLRLCEG